MLLDSVCYNFVKGFCTYVYQWYWTIVFSSVMCLSGFGIRWTVVWAWPHSSTLAWKIPWTEEPGRLQSMGSQRVGHDWATSLSFFTFMHWRRKWQPTPLFLPGESQGQGSLVGCRLWGCTELDTTKVTWQYELGSVHSSVNFQKVRCWLLPKCLIETACETFSPWTFFVVVCWKVFYHSFSFGTCNSSVHIFHFFLVQS